MSGHHAWLWIRQMISYLEQLFSLRGKVAVVNVASIARGFSLTGAHVIGFGRSLTPEWDGNQINADLEYYICDITDEEQLKNQMNRIYNQEKRLDILVNAAGVTFLINETDGKEKMLVKFDKMIQANLRAAYSATIVTVNFMHDTAPLLI